MEQRCESLFFANGFWHARLPIKDISALAAAEAMKFETSRVCTLAAAQCGAAEEIVHFSGAQTIEA